MQLPLPAIFKPHLIWTLSRFFSKILKAPLLYFGVFLFAGFCLFFAGAFNPRFCRTTNAWDSGLPFLKCSEDRGRRGCPHPSAAEGFPLLRGSERWAAPDSTPELSERGSEPSSASPSLLGHHTRHSAFGTDLTAAASETPDFFFLNINAQWCWQCSRLRLLGTTPVTTISPQVRFLPCLDDANYSLASDKTAKGEISLFWNKCFRVITSQL